MLTTTTRAIARTSMMIASIAVAATITIAAARVGIAAAEPAKGADRHATGPKEPSNNWLDGLKAKHKQFFDAPTPNGGVPLVHVMNYYDTYNKAFSVKDADIDAVLTFYGATTFYGLNDAAWAKYQLGEFLETNDATGQAGDGESVAHRAGGPRHDAAAGEHRVAAQARRDAHPLQQRADDLLRHCWPRSADSTRTPCTRTSRRTSCLKSTSCRGWSWRWSRRSAPG